MILESAADTCELHATSQQHCGRMNSAGAHDDFASLDHLAVGQANPNSAATLEQHAIYYNAGANGEVGAITRGLKIRVVGRHPSTMKAREPRWSHAEHPGLQIVVTRVMAEQLRRFNQSLVDTSPLGSRWLAEHRREPTKDRSDIGP